MEALDKLSFGASLLRARLLRKRVPLSVQFSLTNRCNLRCDYCYAKYYDRADPDLPTDQVLGLVNTLAHLGARRISLVGGEPLLRRDIGQIIAGVKGLGLECALTTNGMLVSQKIEVLKQLDLLCISFDGDEEAHDASRGKGSYRRVMQAIKVAKEHSIPLQAATVLNRNNLASIGYVLQVAAQYNFMIGFATLNNQTFDGETKPVLSLPTDEEYRAALREILRLKRQGAPVLFSEKALTFSLNWPYSYEKDRFLGEEPDFEYPKCYAGKYYCTIDVNGDLYPCAALVGAVKVKNCLSDGFIAAWDYIAEHPCRTCHFPCNSEMNLMYGLDLSAVGNVVRSYRRGHR